MHITAVALEQDLEKYLALSNTEDVYITRNGTVVAKLSNPFQDRESFCRDAQQIFLAVANHRTIVTRNLKDYEKSAVPAYSPSAFLKQLENDTKEE